MPDPATPAWLDGGLLALFAVHLAVFARLALRRGELRHTVATATFLCLVGVYAVRLWAPESQLFESPLDLWLRRAAWAGAGLSLGLFLRRRFGGDG